MSILERARHLRATIEGLATVLDDDHAAKNAELFPMWETGVQYEVGDRRRYDGNLWKCLKAHKSQANWKPSDASSLWAKVLIPDPSVIPEWEQPLSTNPYMKGDKVTHNGKTWVSDVDNNVWEPGVFGWSEV